MGPVHDIRHVTCKYATTSETACPSCSHPLRELLYPATGCTFCANHAAKKSRTISSRGTSRPLKFAKD